MCITLFSLCIDETTDVSVTKQLIVYARYLVSGVVHSSFISMLELPDGTAPSIVLYVSCVKI